MPIGGPNLAFVSDCGGRHGASCVAVPTEKRGTMPFKIYTRTVAATLAALASLTAFAQTGAPKTQTVVLVLGGENHVLLTTATTVAELLQEQQVTLTEQLQSSTPLTTAVTEGMEVIITAKDAKVKIPATKVVSPQKKAAGRTLSSRGTLGNLSRYEGKRVLTFTATGYGPGENGGWGNRTSMGTRVRFGVVAVDPRIIKLGTRLYVEGYGECVAEDTGGAIKGMRIDLAFNSDRAANQYGRRQVRVVVLN